MSGQICFDAFHRNSIRVLFLIVDAYLRSLELADLLDSYNDIYSKFSKLGRFDADQFDKSLVYL